MIISELIFKTAFPRIKDTGIKNINSFKTFSINLRFAIFSSKYVFIQNILFSRLCNLII